MRTSGGWTVVACAVIALLLVGPAWGSRPGKKGSEPANPTGVRSTEAVPFPKEPRYPQFVRPAAMGERPGGSGTGVWAGPGPGPAPGSTSGGAASPAGAVGEPGDAGSESRPSATPSAPEQAPSGGDSGEPGDAGGSTGSPPPSGSSGPGGSDPGAPTRTTAAGHPAGGSVVPAMATPPAPVPPDVLARAAGTEKRTSRGGWLTILVALGMACALGAPLALLVRFNRQLRAKGGRPQAL